MRRFFVFAGLAVALIGLDSTRLRAASPRDQLIADLRAHVKHVFVIYQENRSYDSYFGTFPGGEGLASPLAKTHGFRQYDPLGGRFVTPFRIVESDVADADHSRPGLIRRVDDGRMDLFVADEEFAQLGRGATREDAHAVGLLTMAYEDCDTIPFLWKYARDFALYDHIFQGMYGPSTPGNIDIIAAQAGQSQLARHPEQKVAANSVGKGEPVVNDVYPAWGPYHNGEPAAKQLDQTYANVLLTLAGGDAAKLTTDTDEIKDDIASLVRAGKSGVGWGWYQEGFKDDGSGKYPAYITHHNGPQYFGYLRQNDAAWSNVHDLTDLFPAIEQGTLPDRDVVIVKGGYKNPFGWKPGHAGFDGDDDHPAYASAHLSEALVAKVVNAIARSKYWNDSAIVITWDDSEGFYDHVPPPSYASCPDAHPCGDGPRVPLILISPFAKSHAHAVVHDSGDHASFVKFLNVLYDLPALASLPNEAPYLPNGPRDLMTSITDLVGGFDPQRLAGTKPPLAATLATIDDASVTTFPPRMSCKSLGITPVLVPGGMASPPPGFAPRKRS